MEILSVLLLHRNIKRCYAVANTFLYDDLFGFFHICTAKPGAEAVAGDCFAALP